MSENFDVFISYQSEIKNEVNQIFDLLTKNGLKVWMDDQNLRHEENLIPQLQDNIKNCEIFLCCITKKYDESKMCCREIFWADLCEKHLLVVMFESLDIMELENIGMIINPIFRLNYFIDKDNQNIFEQVKKTKANNRNKGCIVAKNLGATKKCCLTQKIKSIFKFCFLDSTKKDKISSQNKFLAQKKKPFFQLRFFNSLQKYKTNHLTQMNKDKFKPQNIKLFKKKSNPVNEEIQSQNEDIHDYLKDFLAELNYLKLKES